MALKQIMTFGLVTFGPVNFGPVTDRQTESDAYEPTMNTHSWAQKMDFSQYFTISKSSNTNV